MMDQHIEWLITAHGMKFVEKREVEGVEFAVMKGQAIEFSHPSWSVIGTGSTILEAETDLIFNGCETYDMIKGMRIGDLTQDTWEMAQWCARCLIWNVGQPV